LRNRSNNGYPIPDNSSSSAAEGKEGSSTPAGGKRKLNGGSTTPAGGKGAKKGKSNGLGGAGFEGKKKGFLNKD
jgi:hypothetical protein